MSNFGKYSEMVSQLEAPCETIQNEVSNDNRNARLLHATLGCVTESAELADVMKKTLAYGKPFDNVNFIEELGDLLWYIVLACNVLDVTLDHIMEVNMNKLQARYGEKFTTSNALNRDLDVERAILEQGTTNA